MRAEHYRTGRQVFVLAAILKAGTIRAKELASLVGIPVNDAHRWLQYLKGKGLIRQNGRREAATWEPDGLGERHRMEYGTSIMLDCPPRLEELGWLGLAAYVLWKEQEERRRGSERTRDFNPDAVSE